MGSEFREERKEFGRWWIYVLGLVIVTSLIFAGLNYAGVFAKTVVEREVFENSYQYTAGQKAKIATYEAQLAELRGKLSNPELDSTTRTNIQAQISAINIQLNAAKAAGKE